MANNRLTGSSGGSGGTYTYNIDTRYGKPTQSTLNNNMSGTEANAIYYATHGGSGYATPESGNVTATPPKPTTTTQKPTGGNTGSQTGSTSLNYDASAYGGGYSNGASAYEAMIAEMLAKQQAAAQQAYDTSRANLDAAYDKTFSSLAKNLELTRGRLQSQYDFNENRARNEADKALREAYVNYMMNKKNLNQGLSALGLSGGATESNMARMYNNYGNSRNNINTTLADNIAMLMQELQGNLANADQLYNSQEAEANQNYNNQLMALNNALMNNAISTYSGSNLSSLANYANALAGLNSTYQLTPATNSLAVNSVSTTQGNDMGSVTDYAKWKAMADNIANQGGDAQAIIYQLLQNGANRDIIHSIYGV